MTLFIDTTDFNSVMFVLVGAGVFKKIYKIDPHKSHETLDKLAGFLKLSKIRQPQLQIQKIIVNKGPGSFTGVRVGAAHALALGLAWKVPMKALPKPKFDQEIKKRS